MTDDPSLTERARQLAAEAEHLYGVTKRRKEALYAAEKQALETIGEAISPDGSVHATVDAGGMLTSLTLTAEALRSGPGDLAALITTVTQQAAGRARTAVRETYASLRAEGIVRGVPVLLPASPVELPEPARRQEAEEEAPYEERSIVRRARRR